MILNRRSFGLYLALLVAIFRVTGVSATENLWFPQAVSQEDLKASEAHTLWASEEIFQVVKLPEYSENLFYGDSVIPEGQYQVYIPYIRLSSASRPQRDLKSHIFNLLFPFHFFL